MIRSPAARRNFARVNCVRRAKIVCTLGPASSTPERLSELVAAGMDVARLNMSHGDYADHLRNLRSVREAAASAGRPVGVLADLQGPKIRLGRFANGKERLHVGADVRDHHRRHRGHGRALLHDLQRPARRCPAGRPDLDRRRPDSLARNRDHRHRRDHRGHSRRTGQQQQRDQPARRRVSASRR